MFGHIIHLPVAAEFKPAQQSRRCRAGVGMGDADFGETQLAPPALDASGKLCPIVFGAFGEVGAFGAFGLLGSFGAVASFGSLKVSGAAVGR
jgi:hypothetical protein